MKLKLIISYFLLLAAVTIYMQCGNISTNNPVKGIWNFNPQKLWEIDKAGDKEFGRPNFSSILWICLTFVF